MGRSANETLERVANALIIAIGNDHIVLVKPVYQMGPTPPQVSCTLGTWGGLSRLMLLSLNMSCSNFNPTLMSH